MTDAVLAAHRALYDAVESGDADLMTSLWVADADVSCVHPGAPVLRGSSDVVRSWLVLMANVGYIQFFLTDVEVAVVPAAPGAEPTTAVVTCTENILSGDPAGGPGLSSTSFGSGTALSTSVLVRDADAGSRAGWKFWSRHASPAVVGDLPDDDEGGL